jgi:hypothetical protein
MASAKIRNRYLNRYLVEAGRLEALKTVERVAGIEPALSAWEAVYLG